MVWTILIEGHQRNSSAKYIEIGPVVSYKKISKFSVKLAPPLEQCILTNHDDLNNLSRGSTKEHCCHIVLKSDQYFLTRKVFGFLYRYRENKPCPWWPCFLTNYHVLNNLGTGSSKEHFWWIILKWVQWFLQEVLKFFIWIYREISPASGGQVFCRTMTAWTILVEGHQRNISAQNYIEIGPVVSEKKIFKVFYTDIQGK